MAVAGGPWALKWAGEIATKKGRNGLRVVGNKNNFFPVSQPWGLWNIEGKNNSQLLERTAGEVCLHSRGKNQESKRLESQYPE